jgi:hypothetical protein
VTVTIETNGASVELEASVKVGVIVTNEVMTQSLLAVEELVEDVVVEFKYCPKNYEY